MEGTAERVHVGRVNFHPMSFQGAVDRVLLAARRRQPLPVRLANAWCVVLADTDERFLEILNGPGLTLADGAPIATVLSRHSTESQRVRGPSLFTSVIEQGRATDARHFLLGATDETLRRMQVEIATRYVGATIAGAWSPPFGPVNESLMREAEARVNSSGASILWVGLGSPKQDYATAALATRLRMPAIGVGAAFDFVAGTVPEAPVWMQRFGAEWLFRLISEPRRLWRRYLIGNFKFLYILITRGHGNVAE